MQDFGGGSTKVRMGLAVKIVMEEQILKRKDLELTLDGIGAQTVLQFSLTVPCALHISGLVTTNLENPMNSMKRQNDRILKDELHRSVGAQYATGDQWRNNSRKKEGMEPKQKQYPVVDVTGDRSKVQCCKEQYCIGTWNVRSMNQGKLEVVKQEMAGVNVDILGISELKWTGMGEFNSDDHYIYYCGQESLRRNRVAIIVNKRV